MPGLVPTPTDREDYYPNPQGARTLSWSNAQGATGVTDELLLQDVYDWQALIFQTDGTGAATNAGVFTVSWFTDPQGNLPCGSDVFVVGVAMSAYLAIPVRAPYVKVQSASITGAGSHISGGRWLVSSLAPSQFTLPQVLMAVNSQTVAGGATLSTLATRVAKGPAHLVASQPGNANAYRCDVVATMPDNSVQIIARIYGGGASAVSDSFILPALPVSVLFNNSDTVAHGATFGLTIGT